MAGEVSLPEARRALCTWAREGLIAARAKRLVVGSEAQSDAEIPGWFWNNLIDDEAGQDWRLGQFVTHVGHPDHPEGLKFCRAYGVVFCRADLLGILPGEGAAESPAKEPRLTSRWHQWVAELVHHIHDSGVPSGVGSQGQEALINAVADGLSKRGVEALSRSTVQPVVQAVLDRLRGAGS